MSILLFGLDLFRKKLLGAFQRWEPWAFWIFALYNLLPVFGVAYFLTGDGPAHLYNAHLIQQLISEPEGFVSNFFYIRTWIIPNLGGHIILAIALYIFDPATAEKLLYGISIIGFIAGFRYYVRGIDHSYSWISWFGLILVHNFCFYIGFQSFSLALGFMLFMIGAWHRGLLFAKWRYTTISAALLVGLAICHVVPLAVFCIYIGLGESIKFIQLRMVHTRRLIIAAATFIPSLGFVGFYILTAEKESVGQMPDFLKYSYNLATANTLVTINWDERIYVVVFQLVMLGCLVPSMISFSKIKDVIIPLTVCLAMLVLYYLMPDKMATGGFISIRLMLFIYIFAAVVAGMLPGNEKMAPIIVLVLGILNISLVNYHFQTAHALSKNVAVVNSVHEFLKPNTTLLPLNYSHHWLHYNIGLYLGAFKPVVVLDNYEASKAAFPLAWQGDMNPGARLGDFGFSKTPLFHLEPYESETGGRIDYVLRYGYSSVIVDANTLQTNRELHEHFKPLIQDERLKIELWARR